MKVREDYRTLSGTEKAAILLLSLGEDQTIRIFEQMDEDEILEISQTMATLGKISPQIIERLFIEFAEQMSSTNTLVGTQDTTERLLMKAGLGDEKISAIMEEIRGPAGRTMWEKLGNVNEEVLATFLQKEYPQTVAVVLSKITSDHAARVLAMLPEVFALEVIHRMLRMEAVQKDILEEVERTLRTEFMTNLARTQRRDSHEMIAEIFNNMDRAAEARFLDELEKALPIRQRKSDPLCSPSKILSILTPRAFKHLSAPLIKINYQQPSKGLQKICATYSLPICLNGRLKS